MIVQINAGLLRWENMKSENGTWISSIPLLYVRMRPHLTEEKTCWHPSALEYRRRPEEARTDQVNDRELICSVHLCADYGDCMNVRQAHPRSNIQLAEHCFAL